MEKRSSMNKIFGKAIVLLAVALVVLRVSTISSFAAQDSDGTIDHPYTTQAELAQVLRTALMSHVETTDKIYFAFDGVTFHSLDEMDAYLGDIYDMALAHDHINLTPNAADFIRENMNTHGYTQGGSYYQEGDVKTYVNQYVIFNLTYRMTVDQTSEVYTTLNTAVSSIISDGMTDLEKSKAIYAYVRDHVTYDYDGAASGASYCHTTHAAACTGKAVCQGYASMFYYMMLQADVDCRVVTGEGNGGPHAWNIIKIDDAWYNVDVTFDSSSNQDYAFFLFSDDTFATSDYGTHLRDDQYKTTAFTTEHPMSSSDNPFADLSAVTLDGCSMFLGNYIILKCTFDDLTGLEDAKVFFTFPESAGTLYNRSIRVGAIAPDQDGKWTYQCRIPARCMTDSIQVQIAFGNNKSTAYDVSARQYAMSVFSSTSNVSYKDLMVALLTYGAYSQKFFDYKEDDLANNQLPKDPVQNEECDVPYTYEKLGKGFSRPAKSQGIAYDSSSLLLKYTTSLRHYFIIDDADSRASYTFEVNGVQVDAQGQGNEIYIQIDGIEGMNLNKDQVVVVKKNGTPVWTDEFNYTPMDYVKIVSAKKAASDPAVSTELSDLSKALYIYWRVQIKYHYGHGESHQADWDAPDKYPLPDLF